MQRTLERFSQVEGIGLHSGKPIRMRVGPSPVDSGIRFRRVDLTPVVEIPAEATRVNDTRLATALFEGSVYVSTVEHLMSAFSGLGIDNAIVEIDAPETPILDGSALGYVDLILQAGIREQEAPRRYVRLKRTIEVKEQDKWARLEPFSGFLVDFAIDFQNAAIDKTVQHCVVDFSDMDYAKTVGYARTFCFAADVEKMHAVGLALGGSLDNAVVVDGDRIVNSEGLRAPDEFVKHKMLDAIGDLYVLGHPMLAKYSAFRSGHSLNNKLLRTLLDEADAWEFVAET